MSFEITKERQDYFNATGKVILNACPGSGKTTTIAHKLIKLVDEWPKQNNYSGIVCLSFTNTAKNEIIDKFEKESGSHFPYPHLISTIDSFVNAKITLPFLHKLLNTTQRFKIVDENIYLNKLFEKDFVFRKKYSTFCFSPQTLPHTISYSINGKLFCNGKDKSAVQNFDSYANYVKQKQLKAGLISSSDSAYFALKILRDYPRIAKYICIRYPHFIIDEAQDTSEIQHAILNELTTAGKINIELVGDPYQCLYAWRDASPDIFLHKFKDRTNWSGLVLSENRRSTQKIVDAFSKLRMKGEVKIHAKQNDPSDLPVHILKYKDKDCLDANSNYERLCRNYKFTNNKIIVRGNTHKNILLGTNEEFKPWSDDVPYQIVYAKLHLENNETKDAMRKFRRVIINLHQPNLNFQELKEVEEKKFDDYEFQGFAFDLLRRIPDLSLSIRNWTSQIVDFLKNELSLSSTLDFGLRKRGSAKFAIADLDKPVSNFFKIASNSGTSTISTIHGVKGMTLDSALLILSENSTGQSISLNDFYTPIEFPKEKQRLMYVAMSRPQNLLCIGVPDSIPDEELKTKFGSEIIIM